MNVRAIACAFFLLLVTIGLFSCRSSKELIYMDNRDAKGIIDQLPDSITRYVIKPGDILYVSIKSINTEINSLFNPESSMESANYNSYQKYSTPQGSYLYGFEVDDSGNLNLPILGSISVAGYPQSEIEKMVKYKADLFVKDAIVKVKLLNYKVTVLGEVKNQGVYYNYNNKFSVLDALALANGNTDYATIKKVLVMRPLNDRNQTYTLDLSKKESFLSEGFYLHPNDYVIVEPDKYKNFQLNSQAYSLIFSSLSIMMAVLGFIL